jgi:hypothetical protein
MGDIGVERWQVELEPLTAPALTAPAAPGAPEPAAPGSRPARTARHRASSDTGGGAA